MLSAYCAGSSTGVLDITMYTTTVDVIVLINAFWMQNSSVNDSSTPFVLSSCIAINYLDPVDK